MRLAISDRFRVVVGGELDQVPVGVSTIDRGHRAERAPRGYRSDLRSHLAGSEVPNCEVRAAVASSTLENAKARKCAIGAGLRAFTDSTAPKSCAR